MQAARYFAALVLTALLAVVVLPDLLGLDERLPLAALVAFRPWLLGATIVLALVLVAVALRRRRVWPFAVGALVVSVVGAALVAPRLVPTSVPDGGRELTVLVANVYMGRADPEAFAALVRDTHPDVVSVPEGGNRFRDRVAPLLPGYRAFVSAPGKPDIQSVDAFVSDRLGDVSVRVGDDSSVDPYLVVTGGTLGPVQVVAFHAAAFTEGRVTDWRADLALLGRWCAGSAPTVVAGDVNATLDHSAFRAGAAGCGDAGAQRGDGLLPTWGPYGHSTLRLFGPQIDHVLSTSGIVARTFAVHDIVGSDHRAIVTTLRLP